MGRLVTFFVFLLLSFSSLADTVIFSSSSAPSDDKEGQIAAQIFKLAPGCDFSVEIGDSYRRITDNKGRSYLLRFFNDGRLSGFESGGVRFVVLYESDTHIPIGVIELDTGRTFSLRSSKGADWYANLRASGKLPSVERIIDHVCSHHAAGKDYFEVQDPMLQDWMSTDYWIIEFDPDFSFVITYDPNQDCTAQKNACLERCDFAFDMASMSCIGMTAIATDMAGGIVGGIAGAACQAAAIYQKWKCRANCDGYPC